MRSNPFALALAALVAASAFASPLAGAAADARQSEVVVKVGPIAFTVADVEARLLRVPAFQLATFGKTPDEIKRAFVERVLVPEALDANGARARKLDERPDVHDRIADALRTARMTALRAELLDKGDIGPDEILRYYEDNRSKFDSPERVAIWRILCKTKEEAAQVIAEAKQVGAPSRWNELAREHSTDKATAMRGGNLGFVTSDGTSNEQGVKADPAIVAAAAKVKDGEIVPEPVPEGGAFAVIWRRGSMPAVHRTVEQETMSIKQVLTRKKLDDGLKALLAKLRADKVRDVSPGLVDLVDVSSEAEVHVRKRPGVVQHRAPGRPAPNATPDGLR
jgi:peptidyl-prolyl cis-trans isomerase C